MENEIPEFNTEKVLELLISINEKAKNMKNILTEIQVEQQKVIIESLKRGIQN